MALEFSALNHQVLATGAAGATGVVLTGMAVDNAVNKTGSTGETIALTAGGLALAGGAGYMLYNQHKATEAGKPGGHGFMEPIVR